MTTLKILKPFVTGFFITSGSIILVTIAILLLSLIVSFIEWDIISTVNFYYNVLEFFSRSEVQRIVFLAWLFFTGVIYLGNKVTMGNWSGSASEMKPTVKGYNSNRSIK